MLRAVIVVLIAIILSSPAQAQTPGGTFAQSAAAEASHIFKASPGNLLSVYASNGTATAGNLMILNSTTVTADGAVVPLDCVPLPASGNASIMFLPGPPKPYLAGIVAVLSSAPSCFTKTTGTITGFISADVQ